MVNGSVLGGSSTSSEAKVQLQPRTYAHLNTCTHSHTYWRRVCSKQQWRLLAPVCLMVTNLWCMMVCSEAERKYIIDCISSSFPSVLPTIFLPVFLFPLSSSLFVSSLSLSVCRGRVHAKAEHKEEIIYADISELSSCHHATHVRTSDKYSGVYLTILNERAPVWLH